MQTQLGKSDKAVDSHKVMREKIRFTREMIDKIFSDNPQSAMALANEGLEMARTINDQEQAAWFLSRIGSCYHWLSRFEEAEATLKESADIYRRLNDTPAYYRTLSVLVGLKNTKNEYTDALQLAGKVIIYHREHGRKRMDYVRILIHACQAHCALGQYTDALECAYEGLAIAENLASKESVGNLAMIYLNIGNIHYYMEDYSKADEYYQRTAEEYRREGKLIGQGITLLNQARIYWRARGEYETALELQFKALEIFIKLGNSIEQIKVVLDIALVYARLQRFDQAVEFLERADSLGKSVLDQDNFLVPCIYLRKADVYSLMRDDAKTLSNLKAALDIDEAHNNPTLMSSIHELLSNYYERQRDFHKAFEHYKEHLHQNDAVRGAHRQRSIDEIEGRAERERMSREAESLKSQLISLEHENQRKSKEAELRALHLWQKNEVLGKIKTYIDSIDRFSDLDKRKLSADVRRYIQEGMEIDYKWEQLEGVLGSLQAEFLEKLMREQPEITATESKICALMKMRLETKEIAGMLFISPQTVYTHRKRIRRKLGLKADESLVTFLERL